MSHSEKQNVNTQHPSQTEIVAEIAVTNADGMTTVVSVPADAGFHTFYNWSNQVGMINRRTSRTIGTKGTVRLEEIPDYLTKHAFRPGLRIASSRVQYFDKLKYEELIALPPDQLPGGITKETGPRIQTFGEFCQGAPPAKPARITDAERNVERRRAAMFGWKEARE